MHVILYVCTVLLLSCHPAHAEFLISTAIVEFTKDSGRQQDIELVSRSKDNDYIVSEVYEVLNPGESNQQKKLVENPEDSGLLVTPDKTILPAGGRKVLRFVLLHETETKERIYRVDIKPVIKGVNNNGKVGLKVLIGYEALVIVRPDVMKPSYTIIRNGKTLRITNSGNTNILLQSGTQCPNAHTDKTRCATLPVTRVYAGQSAQVALPFDAPLTYSAWDGDVVVEKRIE